MGEGCIRIRNAAKREAVNVASPRRYSGVVTCGYLRREQPYVLSSALSRKLRVGIVAAGFLSIAWGIIEEVGKE